MMSTSKLIGKRVALTISDPWELHTACGVGPFYGHIVDIDEEEVLIELEYPIEYQNATYSSATCQVRHEGSSTTDLRTRPFVPMNIALLPKKVEAFADITDDDIRKAFNAIGGLELS